ELIARFTASDAFAPVARLASTREIRPVIENEQALAVLHIGPTFSRDLATGHTPEIQLIIDGRQSNTALIALTYVNAIIEDFSLNYIAASAPPGQSGIVPRLVSHAWFNPSLDTKWFIVPGLVAVLAFIIAIITS